MMNEPGSRWPGRLLAAVDGLLFGWFVFLGFVFAMNLIEAVEFFSDEVPPYRYPKLTHFCFAVIPEETWSLAAGVAGLGIGFGLLNLDSGEPVASRLFRWTLVVAMTLVVGVSLPIFTRYKTLGGGPDALLWDEVLFLVVAASFVVLGIVRLRRRRRIGDFPS